MVTFLACLYINILYTGCVVKRCLNKIWVGRCIGVSYLLVGGPRKRPPSSARNPSQMAFGTTAWVWWVSWKRRRVKVDFFEVVNHHKIQNRFSMLQYSLISNLWGVSNWRSSISTELGWLLWSILGEHGSNQPGKSMDDFGDFGLEGRWEKP